MRAREKSQAKNDAVWLIVLSGWLFGRPAWAAPGATTENFLKIGVAPRAVSLGGAYAGLADDVNAIAYNPAGLAFLDRQEAVFVDNEYVQGIRQDYLAYAYPSADWGSVGLSANILNVSPFNSYDANDQPQGTVSAQDSAVGAAYARQFGRWALGINGKYLRSRLGTSYGIGTAWDAGALWDVGFGLRVGGAIQNMGPSVRFISEADPLPATGRIGVSYQMPLPLEATHFLFTGDAVLPKDRAPYPAAGVEFAPVPFAAIRIGYDGNQDAGSGLSLGAGLKINYKAFGWLSASQYPSWVPELNFDYAFISMGDLGNVHRIGLLVRFGAPKHEDEEPDYDRSKGPVYYGIK